MVLIHVFIEIGKHDTGDMVLIKKQKARYRIYRRCEKWDMGQAYPKDKQLWDMEQAYLGDKISWDKLTWGTRYHGTSLPGGQDIVGKAYLGDKISWNKLTWGTSNCGTSLPGGQVIVGQH